MNRWRRLTSRSSWTASGGLARPGCGPRIVIAVWSTRCCSVQRVPSRRLRGRARAARHRGTAAPAGATPLDHDRLGPGAGLLTAVRCDPIWRAWALGRSRLIKIHRVDPILVVENSADRAIDRGLWRHLTRFVRVRPDLDPWSMSPPFRGRSSCSVDRSVRRDTPRTRLAHRFRRSRRGQCAPRWMTRQVRTSLQASQPGRC